MSKLPGPAVTLSIPPEARLYGRSRQRGASFDLQPVLPTGYQACSLPPSGLSGPVSCPAVCRPQPLRPAASLWKPPAWLCEGFRHLCVSFFIPALESVLFLIASMFHLQPRLLAPAKRFSLPRLHGRPWPCTHTLTGPVSRGERGVGFISSQKDGRWPERHL